MTPLGSRASVPTQGASRRLVYKMRPETTLKLSGLALATIEWRWRAGSPGPSDPSDAPRGLGAVMAESEGIIDTLTASPG